jgi:DNA-binding MurR/RpiR family transcriptional regulator
MLITDIIESQGNQFSATERKLVDYIRNNPNIIFKTITEVIEESKVGYGSIIRFCKKIGCEGFQDFKIRLATENTNGEKKSDLEEDSLLGSYRKLVFKQLNVTMRNIDDKTIIDIAQSIMQARKIVLLGFGGSYPMAEEFSYRLLRKGFDNTSLDADNHVQSYRVSLLNEEDVVFVFSFSGTTKEILDTVNVAKKYNAKIISFTNHVKSPLVKLSDMFLITAIRIPALEAELGTRLPFYFIIEVLTNYLYDNYQQVRDALKITYDSVAKKQM